MLAPEAIPTDVDSLLLQGRFDEARAIYRGMLERDGSSVKVLRALSRLERQVGDQKAASDYVREAAKLDPHNLQISTELAAILRESGRADEASATYRQILVRDARHVPAHLGLGWIARAHKDEAAAREHFAAAYEALRSASETEPNNIPLKVQLATVLRELGRLDEAAAIYERVLAIDARNVQSLNGLGWIAQARGDHEAAVAHFTSAADLGPPDLPMQFNLARLLTNLGRTDEAKAIYVRALARAPRHPTVRKGLGALARARYEWTEALEHFQAALALDPSNAEIRIELARTLCDMKRWDEAADSFRAVLQVAPQNIDALLGLAATAKAQGDRSTALALFENVAALAPLNLETKTEIRLLKLAHGSFDWRTEVEDAVRVARAPQAAVGDQISAARVLIQYGLTEIAGPLLPQIQARQPAEAYKLAVAVRAIERAGLAQPMADGAPYPDVAEQQLESLQGFVEKPVPGSDTMLLVFGGLNNRLWITFTLLQRILRAARVNVVYVRDLEQNLYAGGIVGLGEDVDSSIEGFRALASRYGARRILALGNCIGCVGALRFGLALGAEGVLGFHPRLRRGDDFELQHKSSVHAAARKLGRKYPSVFAEYKDATARPKVTLIFGEHHIGDAANVRLLAEVTEVAAVPLPISSFDSVREILVMGLLEQVLHDFVTTAALAPSTLERIAAASVPS
jgi:tetratricopeptide (TPR) repeat protein